MERNPAREDSCKHTILRKTKTDVTVLAWAMLNWNIIRLTGKE